MRRESTEALILNLLKFNKPIPRLLCPVADDVRWITDHLAEILTIEGFLLKKGEKNLAHKQTAPPTNVFSVKLDIPYMEKQANF